MADAIEVIGIFAAFWLFAIFSIFSDTAVAVASVAAVGFLCTYIGTRIIAFPTVIGITVGDALIVAKMLAGGANRAALILLLRRGKKDIRQIGSTGNTEYSE